MHEITNCICYNNSATNALCTRCSERARKVVTTASSSSSNQLAEDTHRFISFFAVYFFFAPANRVKRLESGMDFFLL